MRNNTYHEGILFGVSLESTMTKLRGSINKLEVNLLKSGPLGLGEQGLKKN